MATDIATATATAAIFFATTLPSNLKLLVRQEAVTGACLCPNHSRGDTTRAAVQSHPQLSRCFN